MNAIKQACTSNNQGVDLLVAGDFLNAMQSFRSALSLLKREASNEVKGTYYSGMSASSEESPLPVCQSTSTIPGLQGTQCYVCDHGIMITNTTNGDSDKMLSFYSAIVLFNLALASHREGMLGSEKSLEKATALYGMALKLLASSPMPDDISATILILLALNNKAQIHYDKCQYRESSECLTEISAIMGSVYALRSALNPKDYEGILLNVMLLNAPTAAQAA
jgi:tetratricopeptide (TPR) repeat protein